MSPKGAVDKEGALEQGFFKPKKVVYVQEKVWGPAERDKLYEGLKTYGVGEWGKMKEHLLPKVRVCVSVSPTTASLCLRSCVLASHAAGRCQKLGVSAERERRDGFDETEGEGVDAALWCVDGLVQWDGLQLRVKSSRLFGSQSVARYTGRKVRPNPPPFAP